MEHFMKNLFSFIMVGLAFTVLQVSISQAQVSAPGAEHREDSGMREDMNTKYGGKETDRRMRGGKMTRGDMVPRSDNTATIADEQTYEGVPNSEKHNADVKHESRAESPSRRVTTDGIGEMR
jgi:hypothetical protein